MNEIDHKIRLTGKTDPNFAWDGERLYEGPELPEEFRGAAASVVGDGSGGWRFVRDPLGINKLFWGKSETGEILVSSRLYTLVEAGCRFEKLRAIPTGTSGGISPGEGLERRTLVPEEWFTTKDDSGASLEELGARIRGGMDSYLAALSAAHPGAEVYVCLSGGLDSTGIAVLVERHFENVTAVSFDLQGPGYDDRPSEDRSAAERLAGDLGLRLVLADATEDELFELLDTVLREGLDWRDFNVHTGLVNAVLAKRIREISGDGARDILVFTGDLANEFLADYEPESYRDAVYYDLPRMSAVARRDSLIKGLDTCHREIGVFGAWDIPVVQPYAVVVDEYLKLGDDFLGSQDSKARLCREIFGDLIPDYIFSRKKVRAQSGNPGLEGGVLAACVDRGFDGEWLRKRFATLHGISNPATLMKFMRAGRYASALPTLEDFRGGK